MHLRSHSEGPGSFSWGHTVPGLTRWRGAGWAVAGPPLASVSPPHGIGYSGEEREVKGESQNLDAPPQLPPIPRCRAKSSQSPMTHLLLQLYQLYCERPPTLFWEQGNHRLNTVKCSGSHSMVQGVGAWWSRLGPCRSLAHTSWGPCGGVICFSLPYCPNFKNLAMLFRKFFFITLRKQFVSVLLFSIFFLFCVLCQLICNSLVLVSDLKLTQVILELA